MTHEFKPGDVVRPAWTHTVAEQANENGHGLLLCTDGVRRWMKNYELAEPSVTHRELREVLEELKRRDPANTSWSAALDAYFFQLTGERP